MGRVLHDAGSFRDPSGQVHILDGRVFRTVMPRAADDFEFVRSTELISKLTSSGRLIPETTVENPTLESIAPDALYVLEHPRLTFVSYPYEWSFSALKAAALLHLDIHIEALEHGVTLSDASAYNIQFQGTQPLFIDSLSFRRYQDGEFWYGHRQFCEQFLNPLLLRALAGIAHNGWYRGEMEGISAESLSRVLPLSSMLSPNVLTHVFMQARFQAGKASLNQAKRAISQRQLPLSAFKQMLKGLRNWIERLKPKRRKKSVWQDYAVDNTYDTDERQRKREFVTEFSRTLAGATLWDIGCNTGDYASAALEAGAGAVIGFENDLDALELAYADAKAKKLNFQPLFLDLANPTPSQGWAQTERKGLAQRATADGLIALAIVHHLAIGRNVPLESVIDWILGLAPVGVIEFVQKSDSMIQTLLQLRDDIFDDYSEETFLRAVDRRAEIVKSETVSASGRRLIWYRRRK